LTRASLYAERAGDLLKDESGTFANFTDFQMKGICDTGDSFIHSSNKNICLFVDAGIWLKPCDDPQYATQLYREKYISLTETIKKAYVFIMALLNKYYEIKHLGNKTMTIIPATKTVYGKLLISNASGETDTKPPFITESMFNTGK